MPIPSLSTYRFVTHSAIVSTPLHDGGQVGGRWDSSRERRGRGTFRRPAAEHVGVFPQSHGEDLGVAKVYFYGYNML